MFDNDVDNEGAAVSHVRAEDASVAIVRCRGKAGSAIQHVGACLFLEPLAVENPAT